MYIMFVFIPTITDPPTRKAVRLFQARSMSFNDLDNFSVFMPVKYIKRNLSARVPNKANNL